MKKSKVKGLGKINNLVLALKSGKMSEKSWKNWTAKAMRKMTTV